MRAAAWLFVLAACAVSRPPQRDYPGTLIAVSRGGDFVRTQRLVARYGSETRSMDAVLQKEGDLLTLIGMTPFGSKAFVLRQKGVEVGFEAYVPLELPFPPKYILLDVQRVYFAGISGAAMADGEHSLERDGEKIVERWAGGRLMARTFARLSGEPAGEIRVVYEGGMAGGVSAKKIEVDNAWVGYRLTITTVQEQAL